MYVRRKIQRHNGKPYSYWQLVRGTRVEGKVRQTVVRHLGEMPEGMEDTKESATKIATMSGHLCSVDGCGRDPEVEVEVYTPSDWTYKHILTARERREADEKAKYFEPRYMMCEEHAKAWKSPDPAPDLGAWPLLRPKYRWGVRPR